MPKEGFEGHRCYILNLEDFYLGWNKKYRAHIEYWTCNTNRDITYKVNIEKKNKMNYLGHYQESLSSVVMNMYD